MVAAELGCELFNNEYARKGHVRYLLRIHNKMMPHGILSLG